jgi:4,5-DOPA dioxygenase extradiol
MHPSLYVPHGAPTFALKPDEAGIALTRATAQWTPPRAILAVSAHWTTAQPRLGAAARPETVHDFYGFPAPLYELAYPAPGAPDLAQQAAGLLGQAGIHVELDVTQGLDHAVWIPLRLMYPAAQIPVAVLSVQPRLGPDHHWELGRALAPLLAEGVLIVASGNLTHSLRDWHRCAGVPDYVPRFADWAWERVVRRELPALLDYRRQAPEAERAHPTEEHLLPLFVALGAAGADYRAERLYQGVSERVLAMDSYALWPASPETIL